MLARATAIPTSRLIPPTTIRAAVDCACRPTTVARTSSRRPLSSSARVFRVYMNMVIRATATMPHTPTW
jgi:hypothetical protein